jgi:hypothetical protein
VYLDPGEDLFGDLPASLPCLLVLAEEFLDFGVICFQ